VFPISLLVLSSYKYTPRLGRIGKGLFSAMKRLRKAFFRTPAVQSALGFIAAGYVWLVRVTSSWTDVGLDHTARAWRGEEPVIIAFWHNRLFLMPYCWPSPQPFHMLISAHADGRLIAKTVAWHGISTVTGSSSKGGADALRALLKRLKENESVGITPDGPRGPRMRAGDGATALARLSGAVIVPAAAATSRRKVLNTWDRLIVPLPFSRGARVWGAPIRVPANGADDDMAEFTRHLEGALIEVSDQADGLVGVAPIPAADPDATRHASA
jgi:lysophospholipid acyltransferase (LPLAT)-like uncharacterized protein